MSKQRLMAILTSAALATGFVTAACADDVVVEDGVDEDENGDDVDVDIEETP